MPKSPILPLLWINTSFALLLPSPTLTAARPTNPAPFDDSSAEFELISARPLPTLSATTPARSASILPDVLASAVPLPKAPAKPPISGGSIRPLTLMVASPPMEMAATPESAPSAEILPSSSSVAVASPLFAIAAMPAIPPFCTPFSTSISPVAVTEALPSVLKAMAPAYPAVISWTVTPTLPFEPTDPAIMPMPFRAVIVSLASTETSLSVPSPIAMMPMPLFAVTSPFVVTSTVALPSPARRPARLPILVGSLMTLSNELGSASTLPATAIRPLSPTISPETTMVVVAFPFREAEPARTPERPPEISASPTTTVCALLEEPEPSAAEIAEIPLPEPPETVPPFAVTSVETFAPRPILSAFIPS